MGRGRRLHPAAGHTTLGAAIDGYLATLAGADHDGTRRVYARILRRAECEHGRDTPLVRIGAERFAAWFTGQWGQRAPATWNVALDAIRSAERYWTGQGWITVTPSRLLRRRKARPGNARVLSPAEVEQLLTRAGIPLRERAFWRMAYETGARSAELLALDVEDLDLANRCARARRNDGTIGVIAWQASTARLLHRLLDGRTTGPLFLTERRARVPLPPGDTDPASGRARLSYQQAEALFKAASGGATLHQLQRSAFTHNPGKATSPVMLRSSSGPTSARSPDRTADAGRRGRGAAGHARRERIAQAAIEMVAERGVDGVTHRAVAATAGVPLGSTTYHFATLDDLLAVALRTAADGNVKRLRAWERELPHDADLACALADLVMRDLTGERPQAVVGYELYVAALHRPYLRPASTAWDEALAGLFASRTDPGTGRLLATVFCGLELQALLTDPPPARAEIEALFRRALPGTAASSGDGR
jgi:DNA-binding transcriptional regulator YbjK/integrase